MPRLEDDRYYAELESEAVRFATAVHDVDPARPVPTCPAWTLAELTGHVGQAFRWVTVVLERRAPVPNDQVRVAVPADPDERSAWLAAGARRLAATIRRVGPRTPVRTRRTPVRPGLGPGPRRRRGRGARPGRRPAAGPDPPGRPGRPGRGRRRGAAVRPLAEHSRF
jgi:hypothetical protein